MSSNNSELLNNILNKLNESIRIIDRNKKIRFANSVLFQFFNFTNEDIIDLDCNDPIFHELGKVASKSLDDYLNNEALKAVEFIQKDKSGIKKYYEANFIPIQLSDNEELILESVRDITQKKMFDREMMQREKLASIGQVASSFAHEIKNPLTGIRLGIDLIKNQVDDETIISGISHDVKRLDQILDQLLNYAKVREKVKEKADINKLIEDSLILLRKQAEQSHVEIKTEFSPIIPQLIIDKNEIQQVLVNLVLNAIQSMNSSGLIEIKTANATITESLGVLISIQDNGSGISEKIIHKINNLFFTTKEEGTGLGLPMSQKIIREHGGSIVFESEEGEGTLVKIFLPIEI